MKLKIRYGKMGRISSPISTSGYVAQALLGPAIGTLLFLGNRAHHSGPWIPGAILLLGLTCIYIGDAVAWLQATKEQREAFRAEIEQIRLEASDRRRKPAKTPMNADMVLFIATYMFGGMFWVFFTHLRPLIVIPIAGWLYVSLRLLAESRAKRTMLRDGASSSKS